MQARERIFQLHDVAVVADDAYQTALVEAYGDAAGDMRYAQVLPSRLVLLRMAKFEADNNYLSAVRAMREARA